MMLVKLYIFLVLILILLLILNVFLFKQGTYSQMTGNGFFETILDKGKFGEYLAYKELKLYEKDGGKFLFNSYLPKDDSTTTEIDVILIHTTGIFVIESKNYSGWIFGSENSKTWTQTLPRGKRRVQKEHFYNPIMQNNTHIKCLKNIVGNNVPIYSLIAFSERCTLKNITVENPNIKVINRQHINKIVKMMGNKSVQALSKMDVDRIYEMLYPYTQTTEYDKLQHIENINAARSGGTKTCPRCGAELVLRTAKKGEHAGEQFYGCSKFPKCRYIANPNHL